MDELKFMGMTLISIIFFSLFIPFSYACPTCSVELGYVRNKADPSTCENIVQTVELEWSEYHKLVDTVNNSVYDAFGNNERRTGEQEFEEAGLSNDYSVNQAKNQFIMTDKGPMMLFDLMQHGVANPNNACHLTHVITTGYMGYSTNVDQGVRFCSEYASPDCEAGRMKTENVKEVTKTAEEIGELQTLIEMDNPDWEKVKNKLKDLEGGWFNKPELIDAEDYKKTIDTIYKEIDEEQYDEAKISIYNLIEIQARLVGEKLAYSPWNFVGSNYTELIMPNAEQIFMFPHNLAAFITGLEGFKGLEKALSALQIATTAVGIANIYMGWKNMKLMKLNKLRELKNVKDVPKNVGRIQEAINKQKQFLETQKKVLKGKTELARISSKLRALKTAEKQIAAIKTVEDYNKLANGAEGFKKAKNLAEGAVRFNELGQYGAELARSHNLLNTYYAAKASTHLITTSKLLFHALNYFSTVNRLMEMGRLAYAVAFWMHIFGKQPYSFFEISTPVFTLEPASTIVGYKSSYVDLLMNSPTLLARDYDIYPSDFWGNVMGFFNIDFREIVGDEHYKPLERKLQKMDNYVAVVDQETKADILTEDTQPTNILYSVKDEYGVTRWHFHSVNPDATMAYFFENPNAYYRSLGKQMKYTTIGIISNNVNISGMTTVEQDWVKFQGNALFKALPRWETMFKATFIAAVWAPASVAVAGSNLGPIVAYAITASLGSHFFTQGGVDIREKNVGYGKLVDIEEAFESGTECLSEKDKQLKKVHNALKTKAITGGASLALETTLFFAYKTGVATTPHGAIAVLALTGVRMAVGFADSKATENVMKKKEEGLQAMKECYETQYEILAWQSIATEAETEKMFTEEFLKGGVEQIREVLGPTLNSLSPEIRDSLKQISQDYYYGTLNLKAEYIKGLSLINIYGTKIYQVHFDREASIKWFAKHTCQIELCDQMADGSYKCIAKQGYFLFDAEGNMIFDGPQVDFLQWSNLETYASIPQRIINIKQADDELMKIYANRISITNDCVLKEISQLTKTDPEDKNAGGVFGRVEKIHTGDEIVWIEGSTVVVHFLYETALGENTYGASQTARFDNANIALMRDGGIKVESEGGVDLLGGKLHMSRDGAISFKNAMILKSKEASISRRGETYNSTYDYTSIDGSGVLHLAIRDLLATSTRDWDALTIAEIEQCIEDGKIQGVTLEAVLNTQDHEIANALLEEMCLSNFEGADGTRIEIRDDTICTIYPDGKEVCQKIEGVRNGNLMLDDGSWWKTEMLDGVPNWAYYDRNGNKQASIPMLWMSGLGGSMAYNPDSGRITIKNEFPFSINPAFNQYGALASPGMAIPSAPAWYGRDPYIAGTGGAIGETQPNMLAQLPLLPESPEYLMIFMIILMSSLIAVRVQHSRIKIKKKKKINLFF